MDLIPDGRSKYRDQGALSLPRLDASIAHGRLRLAAGFLVGGGLILVLLTALPNYLHDSRWSTILTLGMAVPTVLAGLVVLRLGIPARAVLPIAALGDLMVGLETLTTARASAALLNTASLAVLVVFTAIFGTRRDVIVQSVVANAVLISVAHIGHLGISDMVGYVLWSNYGLILPAFAMYWLRQRLTASVQLLHVAATVDPLTGTLNRRGIAAAAADTIRRAADCDATVGALVCDLDRFKLVNDRFGHSTGDQALCAFVAVLEHCVRAEDVVARTGW